MFTSELFQWMRRAVHQGQGRASRRRACTLRVEPLEDRTVPQASGLTGNQAIVSQVFMDLLRRAPDSTGLAFWSSQLNQGQSVAQVALGIENSLEFRTNEVNSLYQCFLNRLPDTAGLSFFVSLLNSQNSEESGNFEEFREHGGTTALNAALTLLLGSPEFFQDQGGTNAGFVTALYQDLLGRAPDSAGAQSYEQALASGLSRAQVVRSFLGSSEFETLEVQRAYEQLLRRNADPTGLQFYTTALSQGQSVDNLVAALVGSPEYAQLAQSSGGTTGCSTSANIIAVIVCANASSVTMMTTTSTSTTSSTSSPRSVFTSGTTTSSPSSLSSGISSSSSTGSVPVFFLSQS
jgi:hypothetical protein